MAVLAVLAPGKFAAKSVKADGPLRWQSPARTSALAGGTDDHLLFGRVVNHSGHAIRLRAADVHILDRDGHRLPTRAAFADGFVPSVMLSAYGSEMYGGGAQAQVGSEVLLNTGAATPIAASFIAGAGQRPAAVEYDGGRLKLR
jgi:hypothetical protein